MDHAGVDDATGHVVARECAALAGDVSDYNKPNQLMARAVEMVVKNIFERQLEVASHMFIFVLHVDGRRNNIGCKVAAERMGETDFGVSLLYAVVGTENGAAEESGTAGTTAVRRRHGTTLGIAMSQGSLIGVCLE